MKKETLMERIENAGSKLVKLNGTLERHTKQLEKKRTKVVSQGVDINNYDRFDYRRTQTGDDLWDYERKLEDIENTNKKIKEVVESIKKLNKQLAEINEKENKYNNEAFKILDTFLENWKQKAIDFYLDLSKRFLEVKLQNHEITKEELQLLTRKEYSYKRGYEIKRIYEDEEIEIVLNEIKKEYSYQYSKDSIEYEIQQRYIKSFRDNHFASDMLVLDKIIENDKVNNTILNKILNDEVKAKKEIFIQRVEEITGELKDLSRLEIGIDGEINGIAEGYKGKAKVNTIGAGGYNIQCYHYRVLVKEIV